jgi:diacylglycerol kinase family enzyme
MTANRPIVIVNSGKTAADRKYLAETIEAAFKDLNITADITVLAKRQNYNAVCEKLVVQARKQNTAVVAVGGDGTVNLLAGLCCKHGATLGIIPQGTFNYFARNLGISTDLMEAVKIIADNNIGKATLGFVNEHVFVNKVSFGLWTKLIRQREEASSLFGRLRIVAVFSAIYSMLQRQKIFTIHMDSEGEKTQFETSMVFVCNNKLQLENVGLQGSKCVESGHLAVIALKKATRLQVVRCLIRGLLKSLSDEGRLSEFCSGNFKISSRRRTIDIVIDGEIVRSETPLIFESKKNALNILLPALVAVA